MNRTFFTTDPDGYLEPRGLTEPGGTDDPAVTIVNLFSDTVVKHGDKPALCRQLSQDRDWIILTWSEYFEDAKKFAKALFFLKIPHFGKINILGIDQPLFRCCSFSLSILCLLSLFPCLLYLFMYLLI